MTYRGIAGYKPGGESTMLSEIQRTKSDLLNGIAGIANSRKFARNTVIFTLQDGTECLKYHDTTIVTKRPDGTTVLNSGGFHTRTTKERIREFAHVDIYQKNGVWYMSDGSAFYDGIVVKTKTPGEEYSGKTTILSEKKPVNDSAVNEMKKQIRNYCLLITPENIPKPEAGDCFFCRTTDSGKTLGDATNNHAHLLSHLEEGYVVGSLIVNALKESHYPPTSWGFLYHEATLNKDGGNSLKDIRKVVSQYLQRRLIPGIAVR